MREASECVHGMEYGCSICSGKDVRRPTVEEVRFSYRAKYHGHCAECDLPIAIGQQCVKTTKERNLHEDCSSTSTARSRCDGSMSCSHSRSATATCTCWA
jgi:hypothetical protein